MRNILGLVGFGPVRHTIVGTVEQAGARRQGWSTSAAALGRCGRPDLDEVAPAYRIARMMTSCDYADVNGIKLNYEIHRAGEPLVLLIAVELQGHGRTADSDRPLRS